jgi:hypothetical protein
VLARKTQWVYNRSCGAKKVKKHKEKNEAIFMALPMVNPCKRVMKTLAFPPTLGCTRSKEIQQK